MCIKLSVQQIKLSLCYDMCRITNKRNEKYSRYEHRAYIEKKIVDAIHPERDENYILKNESCAVLSLSTLEQCSRYRGWQT